MLDKLHNCFACGRSNNRNSSKIYTLLKQMLESSIPQMGAIRAKE